MPELLPHQIEGVDELYPFQQEVVDFLSQRTFGLNLLSAGMGKTIINIALAKKLNAHKTLIVVPKSVIHQWGEVELPKWDKKAKIFIVEGSKLKRLRIYEKAKQCQERFYLILGYDTVRTDIAELQKF